jgi:2-oxoglutarate/2-oxoacid ferredoxin oxidoreductase subunit beta
LVILKKLEHAYDPTDKWQALQILEEAEKKNWLVTGLIFVDPNQPSLYDYMDLVEEPMNRTPVKDLRPQPETLEKINQDMA